MPPVRSRADGSLLVMERSEGGRSSRVAVDLRHGGVIAEASVDGVNVVNSHDTGRAVQVALYDGAARYDACAGCSGEWGWNPVQGGDIRNRGSAVLDSRFDDRELFVRTRATEWLVPGASAAVASDVVIEQRITPVEGDVGAWRVDFRIEVEGTATRTLTQQELPAAYAGAAYRRLVTYAGSAPWTGAPTSAVVPPSIGQPSIRRHAAERWFALVDDKDMGLTVFGPGSQPWASGFVAPGAGGPTGAGTVYGRLDTMFAVRGGQRIDGHYFLFAGDYKRARETIYRLRAQEDTLDLAAPRMVLDGPVDGSAAGPIVDVVGWAFDNRRLQSVDVYVDDQPIGAATRGVARPDVAAAFADAPGDSGFRLSLDMRAWTAGTHVVTVVARDDAGNDARAQARIVVAAP